MTQGTRLSHNISEFTLHISFYTFSFLMSILLKIFINFVYQTLHNIRYFWNWFLLPFFMLVMLSLLCCSYYVVLVMLVCDIQLSYNPQYFGHMILEFLSMLYLFSQRIGNNSYSISNDSKGSSSSIFFKKLLTNHLKVNTKNIVIYLLLFSDKRNF